MAIIDDTKLRRIITTSSDLAAASMATRIVVTRMRVEVTNYPDRLSAKIAELRDFVKQHDFARDDLSAM